MKIGKEIITPPAGLVFGLRFLCHGCATTDECGYERRQLIGKVEQIKQHCLNTEFSDFTGALNILPRRSARKRRRRE
jgi:hypothetical protein